MIILGRALTILLGAFPATYLSVIAALGMALGVMTVADGEPGAVFLIVWGGAGIFGTLSLWAAGLGSPRPWVVVGLIIGSAAILPLVPLAVSALGILTLDDVWALTVLGPFFVAIVWLCVLTARAFVPHVADTLEASRG